MNGCPDDPICQTCPAASEDDVCLPHERSAAMRNDLPSSHPLQGENYGDDACIHGERGWCALCVGPTRTAESMGLPLVDSPASEEHSAWVVIPLIGLALAVAAFGAVIVWVF